MVCCLSSCIVWHSFLFFTLSVRAASVVNANVTAPIVDLGYAQYQGSYNGKTNITSFLSIRYATPPLGNLGFQVPQPPAFEPGVQLAVQNPDICYQAQFGNGTMALVPSHGYGKRQSITPAASEDCLYLNVFVPGKISTEPVSTDGLPVLVWIHGGGVDMLPGSTGSISWMIVIQYRLGLFGFLSGNEVKVHGGLNAGLFDQTLALKWVQDYIGLFGGDKAHVIIWGNSAGAGSVLQHIVANGGNTQPPLFNAAMASSTFLPPQYCYSDRVPQLVYDRVVSMTGCSPRTDTFTCLQSVDADTLQTVNQDDTASGFFGTYVFVPVVDGMFIVECPTVTLAKGKLNGQVLLAFNNQNEGNTFVNVNENLTITDYVSQLFPDMTNDQVQKAANVYRDYGTAVEQAIMVMGDSIFVCPTYTLLSAFVGRAWKGLFAVPPAHHGDDIFYYFDIYPPYNNSVFITAFSQSFMSLAKYFDVNEKFDPTNITPWWNKYDIGETEMLFNHTEAGVPIVHPIETDLRILLRWAFWSTVTSTTVTQS